MSIVAAEGVIPSPLASNTSYDSASGTQQADASVPDSVAPSQLRSKPLEAAPVVHDSITRYRRRASLSDLPPTPPPFSQYFQPEPAPVATVPPANLEPPPTACAALSIPSLAVSPSSPLSPISSELSSPSGPDTPSIAGAATDTTGSVPATADSAMFRERRLRAAKLARFFGVEYGDLLPALAADGTVEKGDIPVPIATVQPAAHAHDKKASRVSRSLDLAVPRSIRLLRMSRSFERSNMRQQQQAQSRPGSVEPLLASMTERQRRSLSPAFSSAKGTRTYGYASHSRGSSRSTASGFGSLEGVSVVVQREVDAWNGAVPPPPPSAPALAPLVMNASTGASSSSSASTTPIPTPSRVQSPSPVPESQDGELESQLGHAHSQEAMLGSRSPTPSVLGRRQRALATLTLGRKGSMRTREAIVDSGVEAQPVPGAGAEWTWRDSEPSFVRVGEKPADRLEVISRLRELR